METKVETSKGVATKAAPSAKEVVRDEKSIRIKEVTLHAAREFITLPKKVQDETMTRIGAFAKKGEVTAFRSLSDDEIDKFGVGLIGVSRKAQDFEKVVNEYFNNFTVNVPFDVEVKLHVPIYPDGGVALVESKSRYILDVMRYRHVKACPKVANSYTVYKEAPQMYLAYISDTNELRTIKVKVKNIKKEANILSLEIIKESNKIKLSWVLELARRGILTKNVQDLPNGYIPSVLRGVRDIEKELDVDDKEIAVDEFKDDRPEEFVALIKDPDLEWKALLERLVVFTVLVRQGNVVMYEHKAIGGNDKEAIATLKSPGFSKDLTTLKARLNTSEKARVNETE